MSRTLVTQDELANIINSALKSSDLLDGDCRQCHVRGFYRLVEPDGEGCNWELPSYSGPKECAGVVMAIVAPFRKQYNIKDS